MPEIAEIAALIAEPTRMRMLEELLGPPLSAGALAMRVGVAPSTISGHLAKLEAARIVTIESRGRTREARLAGPEVAEALEALARLTRGEERPIGLRAVNRRQAMREARSCYDHLAGRAGVALADTLVEHGALELRDGAFLVPGDAERFYADAFGVELEALQRLKRPLVRACVDWTERCPHVAGALGAALLDAMLGRGWVRRRSRERTLEVTQELRERLVLPLEPVAAA